MAVIQSNAPARYDAVDVWVMVKILPPCVEHGEETDVRSKVFGIPGNGAQGLRGRSEQHPVYHSLVL